jgi:glycerate-2-kinase
MNIIDRGTNLQIAENPKVGDRCFEKVYNYLIGSVESAVQQLKIHLENQNFKVEYFSNKIQGEASIFGEYLCSLFIKTIQKSNATKIALIGTGELTVTIKGKGIGGRNQEMLLNFLNMIKNEESLPKFIAMGVNLDGIEGNSQALGALVDYYSYLKVRNDDLKIKEFLRNNDSNTFFKQIKSEIITGPTGSNVNDIVLLLLDRG